MELPICFNTSDNKLEDEFYNTCLQWANRYDRGVGYFSSQWISRNAKGMVDFIIKGGKARWIVSPILNKVDFDALNVSEDNIKIVQYFEKIMMQNIDKLVIELEENTRNALAWMVFDGVLEFRFAVPTNKLRDGDFHDKFGVFYGPENARVSFSGSINDSAHGFINYESIKVFRTWDGTEAYVNYDQTRFEKLWTNNDLNVKTMVMTEGIKNKIFELRSSERPYTRNHRVPEDKWSHQEEAIDKFMLCKHGILEMATGTGKTRTALKIIEKLFDWKKIDRVIISMYGNDLLYQWEKEIRKTKKKEILLFEEFERYKEMSTFILSYHKKSILIVSREAEKLSKLIKGLERRDSTCHERTLIVFDEVHGLGARSLRNALENKISKFKYRLGLSATPEREYDEEGNNFIEREIGPVIFKFTLEDAIKKGILCEFDYVALVYQLTDEEKQKKRGIIAYYEKQKKQGKVVSEEEEYRALAYINKTSVSKLPLFEEYIGKHEDILERCIIFVEDREFGRKVQEILIKKVPEYHTYYSDDDRHNLEKFAQGELKCLITCKKLSEGVDIKSVKNIIIFSSDRSKLVTTQRIGRSLRVDPDDPTKRAFVLDFVLKVEDTGTNTDMNRREWLTKMAKIRRSVDE